MGDKGDSTWAARKDEAVAAFGKGLLTGLVMWHLSKRLVSGALVGVAGAIYYQHECGARHVKQALQAIKGRLQCVMHKGRS